MGMIEVTVNLFLCELYLHALFSLNYIALDEMGTKIDELEQSINDLKAEMGTEMPTKKPEEAKPADSA